MSITSLLRPDGATAEAAPPTLRFGPERAVDAPGVDALIAHAFGPGRYAKTAERLREGAAPHPELSVCAWRGEMLLGAVRLWPARIGTVGVLFLGPIAVERTSRRAGLGAALVGEACARARARGERAIVLVGDIGFFGPLGFEPVSPGRVALPGPVDPARVLWTGLIPGGLDGLAGRLTAEPAA